MYMMWQVMARPGQEKPPSGREWMQIKGEHPKCGKSTSFKAWNLDIKPE